MSNDTEREFGDVQDIVEPMAATIIELNREVQRLKSENARLAAQLADSEREYAEARKLDDEMDNEPHREWLSRVASKLSERERLKSKYARLRDLLAPTIELLERIPPFEFVGPGWIDKHVKPELAHLRAACREKDKK